MKNDRQSIKEILNGMMETISKLAEKYENAIPYNKDVERELKSLNDDVSLTLILYQKKALEIKELEEKIDQIIEQEVMPSVKLCKDLSEKIAELEYRPLNRVYRKIIGGAEALSNSDIDIIEDFKEIKKEDPAIWVVIGHIYWNLMYPRNEIYQMFENAVALDLESACGWCGKTVFYGEEDEKTLENIDKTLSFTENQECPSCIINMASKYSRLGKSDKCFKLLEKAKKMDDTSGFLYNTEALNYILNLEDAENALVSINKAIERDLEFGTFWFHKGNILLALDKIDEAEEAYLKAIEYGGNLELTHLSLVKLYLQKEDWKKIITYSTELLKIDDSNVCINCHRGRAYKMEGRYEEALNDFYKIFETPDLGLCNIFMPYFSEALVALDDDSLIDEILVKYKDVILKDINKHSNLISNLLDSGKSAHSEELFSWIDKDKLETPLEMNAYAYSAYKLGKSDLVLDIIKEAYQKDPENPIIIDTFACVLSQLEHDNDAIELFNKLIERGVDESLITMSEMEKLFKRNRPHNL